ncbi:hypothetical protein BY458DRAFT_523279 [Sporodiniella umbellata]|nr:hypothetical protein BY458DRAFT_523262 [Sporodiniella umbellata]KAI9252084.1 hypothetical protein BY458DRAFT_523279 [Sporodiniella umbellata]
MIATHTISTQMNNENTERVRHNSFSSMMKNLLSMISRPTSATIPIEDPEKRLTQDTLFEVMYESFPAIEDQDEAALTSNCHPSAPILVQSSRVMC